MPLVQCGRNNPPVKKGSKAYCKTFLPFCLVTERVEVLPHDWSLSVSKCCLLALALSPHHTLLLAISFSRCLNNSGTKTLLKASNRPMRKGLFYVAKLSFPFSCFGA